MKVAKRGIRGRRGVRRGREGDEGNGFGVGDVYIKKLGGGVSVDDVPQIHLCGCSNSLKENV